jgi:hypothetical protein
VVSAEPLSYLTLPDFFFFLGLAVSAGPGAGDVWPGIAPWVDGAPVGVAAWSGAHDVE